MAGLFSSPKIPAALPTPNPGDTQNRMNDALATMLQGGGQNADMMSGGNGVGGSQAAARQPTLTGLN